MNLFRPDSPGRLDGDRELLVALPLLLLAGNDVRQLGLPPAPHQEAVSGSDPQEPERALQEGLRALADQSEGTLTMTPGTATNYAYSDTSWLKRLYVS